MQQYQLFKTFSVKPTFWYPGSKGAAVNKITKMIPRKTKEIVSPFIGGGSIEIVLSARGVKIYGYDKYEPLVNCWKYMLKDSNKMAKRCREIFLSNTREELRVIFKDDCKIVNDPFEQACCHWIRASLEFRGIISPNVSLCQYDKINGNAVYRNRKGESERNLCYFDRLETFYSPNLTVDYGDFEDTLANHPNIFAYLDPPYPAAGTSLYGGTRDLDSQFDHERLAKVLLERETPFLLSYNDKEIIQMLYPKSHFDWTYQDWFQMTSQTKRIITNEVIIRPKKYLDYFN